MSRESLPAWPRGLGEAMASAYVGLSVSGVRTLRRAGDFPRPVRLSPGRIVWLRDHLDQWLDAKAGAKTLTGNILDDLPDA